MRDFFAVMRVNLIWYIPLSVAVFLYFVVPDITSGYHNVALVFHRFSWPVLISPAAYIFISCLLASIFLPVQLMLMVPAFFDRESPAYGRRYVWSLCVFVGIAAACFVLQVLIWGSFPLPVDQKGYIHFRMIPFIPWPETPLFG